MEWHSARGIMLLALSDMLALMQAGGEELLWAVWSPGCSEIETLSNYMCVE